MVLTTLQKVVSNMQFNSNAEIVEYLNRLGGRTTPFIVLETCEQCGIEYAVQIQDKQSREQRGISALCPVCRAEDIKRQKREAERLRRQRKKE